MRFGNMLILGDEEKTKMMVTATKKIAKLQRQRNIAIAIAIVFLTGWAITVGIYWYILSTLK